MNPITEGRRIKLGYDYFAKEFSGKELTDVWYRLTADRKQERLLFETATIDEVDEVYNLGEEDENCREKSWESDPIMEAIRVRRFSRTEKTMTAFVRAFNLYTKDSDIDALPPVIGKPKRQGLFASVTVQIPFTDGQVLSIVFHSPDGNKMKITPEDEILAFRWLLNKRDITQAVSPEGDAEISLEQVAKRTAQLVEKNSARFQATQKEIVEQKKQLEEVKVQVADAGKRHDELMENLQTAQDNGESLDAQAANLKTRIEKQKAFNADLQEKIDALTAQKAGNDGKAKGGETPKTETEIKAEQDQAAFEEAKASYETNLRAMGFKQSDEAGFKIDVIDTAIRNGQPMGISIKTNYYTNEGKIIVVAGKQRYSALLKNASGAFKKAEKALADEKAKLVTVAEWMLKYGSVAPQFVVGSEWAVLKFMNRPEDGYFSKPAIVTKIMDAVSGSFLPGIELEVGESTVLSFDYEQLSKAVADGSIKPWDEQAKGGETQKIEADIKAEQDQAAEFLAQRAEIDKAAEETARLQAAGTSAVPGIRLSDAEEAGRLWEMKERGELSSEEWDKYVADLKASNKIAAEKEVPANGPVALVGPKMTEADEQRVLADLSKLSIEELTAMHGKVKEFMEGPDFASQDADYKESLVNTESLLFTAKNAAASPEPPTEPVAEPGAVTILQDIIAGKYGTDTKAIDKALDDAAAELESLGLLEKYDELLNEAADTLTAILREKARGVAA